VLPARAVQTGFGGAAPVPGSSPLPWLITVAAGLLVTLAGIARLRKSRRALHVR